MKENVSYCGIDVGLRNHAVCLMSSSQEVVSRFFIKNNLDGFTKLEKFLSGKTKICLEPTGVYSVNIFVYSKKKCYDIRFCNTRSSRRFREAMYGKRKHDKLDSVSLAKYRIVNESLTFDRLRFLEKQELKSNSRFTRLEQLSDEYRKKGLMLSKTKTRIKRVIDLRFPEAMQIFSKDRASKAIITVLQYSRAEVLKKDFKVDKFNIIKSRLKDTIGQFDCKIEEFNKCVNNLKKVEEQKKQIVEKLRQEVENHKYSGLLGLCGFDVVNTAYFINEVRDIKRFFRFNPDGSLNKKKSLSCFKGFLGLKTTSSQSGEREGGHKLVKSGNNKLRAKLFMLAMTYISFTKDYGKKYKGLDPYKYRAIYEELIKRKRKMVALVKVMSKVATDLFFVLKDLEYNQSVI